MTISGSGAKWLIGVAAVSLCANLFLVGLMAGHMIYGPGLFGRHGPDGAGPDGPRRGMEAMIAGVPEDLRPMIRQKFEAAKPQFQAQREKIRAARDKVAAAGKADPFDPAAFDQAFAEFQEAMGGMGAIAHQTIREILPQIPAEQRQKLVDKWAKRWGPKGDGDGPDGPDGPPPPPPGDQP